MANEFIKGVTLGRFVDPAFVLIGKVKSASIDKTVDMIDVTTQDSPDGYKEYAPGLKDGGEITVVIQVDADNKAKILELDASYEAGTMEQFELTWPTRKATFYAYVSNVTFPVEVNKYFESTVKLRSTGKMAITAVS